jgi:hypothetical protein
MDAQIDVKKSAQPSISPSINVSTPISQGGYSLAAFPSLPAPIYPPQQIVISEEDILRIAAAVKQTLRDDITQLVAIEVAKAVEPLQEKIQHLESQNTKLFHQLDELEQYGRRPLVRVTGIPENLGEDTTSIILNVAKKAGVTLQSDEVVNSHRVGNPKNSKSGPRQIIARLKSVDVKFRLVKSHKQLKKHPETKGISFNEDLTKYRDKLLFLSRTLCRNNMLKQAWSSNGKIRVRDKSDRVHIIRHESDLVSFGHVISE